MNRIQSTSPMAKYIGTAIALSIASASAFGIGATPNPLGTPDDGMICRSGYTGAVNGNNFKCSKTARVTVPMKCTRTNWTYVVRAAGSPDSAAGIDLCTRPGVNVGSTDSLSGLVNGQDYAYVVVDTDKVTEKTTEADQAEATALGLDANEVDTAAGEPRVVPSGGTGSQDRAEVTLTHYTFAIKTGINPRT
jgi:hypothetical protein